MAKEFKRSGNKNIKGKKPFSSSKESGTDFGKKTSFKRSDSNYSDDNFKRSGDKEFEGDKSFKSKKERPDKRDDKPAFERFRDDSRPSDFGSSKKRGTSRFNDSTKKRFSDKPDFKKKRDDGDEKPAFRDKGDDSRKPFNRKPFSDKPAFKKKFDDGDEKPSFRDKGDDNRKPFNRKPFADKPSFKKKIDADDEKPSFRDKDDDNRKPFNRKPVSDKPAFKKKFDDSDEKPSFRGRGEDKRKPAGRNTYADKPAFVRKSDNVESEDFRESDYAHGSEKPQYTSDSGRGFKKSKPFEKKTFSNKKGKGPSKPQREEDDGLIRLNKYLSNAGICSRREADVLISSGVVQVNGKNITEMGYRVKPTDIVKYGGQTLKKERLVYLILNKPKDYITTADDPQERRTVLELVQGACKERIYPVGRLDRATTGLLMFTNDGELTKKLTHPRYGVRKIYHVELDKPLKRADLDAISEGLELEDGPIKVDEVTYVGDGDDKAQVGVEIHSGKNRIVRRIFEHMGYNVRKLDRVLFGSLTKKDLPRGRWRLLTEAEIGILKMISAK
jgi:23S rRNA pseudouridine2605 synthase